MYCNCKAPICTFIHLGFWELLFMGESNVKEGHVYFFFPLRVESLVPNDTTIKSAVFVLSYNISYFVRVRHFW